MNIFKSAPAIVAFLFTVLAGIVSLWNVLQPFLLTKVPTELYPLIGVIVGVIFLLLHYEKAITDGVGVLAGSTPFQTFLADIQAAIATQSSATVSGVVAALPTAPAPAPIVNTVTVEQPQAATPAADVPLALNQGQ